MLMLDYGRGRWVVSQKPKLNPKSFFLYCGQNPGPTRSRGSLIKTQQRQKINNKTILIRLHLNRTSMVIKGFNTRPKHTHLATPPWHDRSILTAQVAIQNRIRVILPTHAASHIINLCITWFLSSTNLFTVYSIRKRFYSDNPTVFN